MRSSPVRRPRLRLEQLESRLAPSFGAIGPEFRVNSFTTGNQNGPRVAADADGDFVVVWRSTGQDGSGYGVFAQRYSSAGTTLGADFRVNTFTTTNQGRPAVAANAAGDFVVVWDSANQDGSSYGVYAQRYNSAGAAQGGEFRVNEFTTGGQAFAAVAVEADGDFVVVWDSNGQDGSGYGVFAQRYNSAGAPQGGEFRVNEFTTGAQLSAAVAVDAGGDFVVVWQSLNQDGSGEGVYAQRYSSVGAPLGGEFRVNTFTTSNQDSPAVAANAAGDFVVAWESSLQDGTTVGIYAQRYSAAGVPLGAEFQVETFTTGSQRAPAVSADADGDFVVSWTSFAQDGSDNGVFARRYNSAGAALGNEFRVNTFTTGAQTNPVIAADADGDFVVVWESNLQDGDFQGVYAQRYTDLDNNGDTAGPAIAAVTPSGAPNAIRPDDRLTGSVAGFVVAFTEDMSITGGTNGTGSATNLTNYRLARNGVDISSLITGVNYGYNPAMNRFESALSLNAALGDGLYTLTLRSALSDIAFSRFDGRGDSSGFATDFALPFTIAGAAAAGPEVRANTFTTNDQRRQDVAVDAAGNYVVTWDSSGQDGSGYGVYAQRYSAAGVPQGPEFRVNTFTTGAQLVARVAMSATGDFIIAWTSDSQDGSLNGVYAQRYSAVGVPVGAEFRVNTFTTSSQTVPAVAMNAAGEFVVAWSSSSQDFSASGVYAQRYSANGTTRGAEFRVNTFTTGSQKNPAIAFDAAGDFIVAWDSDGQDGAGDGIYAQRYSSEGSPLGTEFRVNTVTANDQSDPTVSADAAGDFVVAWSSYGQDGSLEGVYVRRFSAAGAPLGGEFQANTFTANAQFEQRVAMNAAGEFVVTWGSTSQDGGGFGVYLRRFSAAGAPIGAEIQVNTVTTSNQQLPAIAMTAAGDYVIAWISPQDGDSNGIYHQRYARTVAVESVRAVGGATPIAPGGVLVAPIPQLVVTFSGPLVTAGAGNVTNVARWQLARYGTLVAGAITGITFASNEATLTFSAPLNDGRFTLTALPSILDPDGRALDGNFDGAPGGAFVITFDVKPVPARGPETRVNSFTTGNQSLPAVAMDATGKYVVAWVSNGQDGGGDGVYAQRYSTAGAPLGPEFRVNSFTTGAQAQPTIGMNAAGDFVVAWESLNQEGAASGYGIYAQRYSAAGAVSGSEFRVNTFTTGNQTLPALAVDATGDFVVTWSSDGQDGAADGVFARRYSANGLALGGEFLVNTFTTNDQSNPAVGMDIDGDFVITWQSANQDGNGYGVYAQRYSASGLPLGGEFAVNQFTTSNQSLPSIGIDAAGQFVIAWASNGQDGNLQGVFARRYNTIGTPLASEFRVNSQTTNVQSNPGLAVNAAGDFVVTWSSLGQDGSTYGIYAQRYAAGGATVGGEFRVNTFTTGSQLRPAVAIDAIGDFVIAWSSPQDGDGNGVYHQRYVANLTPTSTGLPGVNIPVSPPTNYNLAAGLSDIEDGAAGLIYTVVGNTNPALFTSIAINGTTLTLTPAGPGGSATLTIRGTDSGGLFVEETLFVQVTPPAAPRVIGTQINGGAAQRSRVTSLAITFSAQVTFAGAVANAFTLTRNGGGAVNFTAAANVVSGVIVVTLNAFTGAETESGSLKDGRYTLTALQSQISAGGLALDGDGNGTGGDDFTFGDAQGLFRFYGDMNADRRIDISDFGFFSLAYLTQANYIPALDFNNDGRIDISDFGQFSVRYFTTLP